MEHIGAGLAALGVIGPGIGIGILAGLAARRDRPQPRCGRPDPRPRDHPRRVRRRPRRARDRRRPARDLHQAGRPRPGVATRWMRLAVVGDVVRQVAGPAAEARAAVPDQPVLDHRRRGQLRRLPRPDRRAYRVQAVATMLERAGATGSSRACKDAEQAGATARRPSRSGSAALQEARREANEILDPRPEGRARRPASRTSPRPARSSSGMRERATAEIEAEKQRADRRAPRRGRRPRPRGRRPRRRRER